MRTVVPSLGIGKFGLCLLQRCRNLVVCRLLHGKVLLSAGKTLFSRGFRSQHPVVNGALFDKHRLKVGGVCGNPLAAERSRLPCGFEACRGARSGGSRETPKVMGALLCCRKVSCSLPCAGLRSIQRSSCIRFRGFCGEELIGRRVGSSLRGVHRGDKRLNRIDASLSCAFAVAAACLASAKAAASDAARFADASAMTCLPATSAFAASS